MKSYFFDLSLNKIFVDLGLNEIIGGSLKVPLEHFQSFHYGLFWYLEHFNESSYLIIVLIQWILILLLFLLLLDPHLLELPPDHLLFLLPLPLVFPFLLLLILLLFLHLFLF
jgi:hypothetical protein